MRILICALDGPEPRTNGIRLAVAALLEELRKKHQIRYLGYRMADQHSLADDTEIRLIDPPPRPIRGTTLLRATLRGRPWDADQLAVGMEDALAEELETFEPDVVHVTRWALAGLGTRIRNVGSVLTTFDAWHLNVDASLATAKPWRRPLLRAEARRIRRFEAEEFEHFGRVVVVSEEDKAALEALNPSLSISVIPNGVNSDFFSGDSAAAVASRIVFTGNMSYPPNVVAATFLARHVLPRVRAVRADAHVVIVGRDPHPQVISLAALDGVKITGEVDDVRPWLRSAHVFLCPMLNGTGIKNKLLEAMASELPCVVTPLALQGIGVTPGEHVLVGESAEMLAVHVVTVMGDDAAARRLGQAARAYVRSRHSWAAAAKAYDAIYTDVRIGEPHAIGFRGVGKGNDHPDNLR
jgi:glycosyltransferase involved in cell wall biosynthesis